MVSSLRLLAFFALTLGLSSRLDAGYARAITPGPSRPWSPDAIGVNGQTAFPLLRDNPFSNVDNISVLSRSLVNIYRYPGGTTSNYFDWPNGRQFAAANGDFKLANLKLAYDAVGFTPHFVVNMLTPAASSSTERLNSALAMLSAAQALGLPVTHVELGNEFYLNDADYVAAFPSGTTYGTMCQTWIAAIKAQFPGVKCAIAVTMETRTRLNTWSSEVLSACNNYDALVVHWYPTSGHEPSFPSGSGTLAEQETQFALFNATDGVTKMLGQPAQDWSEMVAANNLPANAEIWVTEFNLKDSNAAVRQTWAHGLFVANQFHALLSDGRVRRLAAHNWAGGNKPLNYTAANELDNLLVTHGQGNLATTPYQFAAPGFAVRLFAEVADGCTGVAPLQIESAPQVSLSGTAPYSALYGWQFTTSSGARRTILVNTSGTDYDVKSSGLAATATHLRQVSGNPRTYVTGENATLTRRTSIDVPTTLRLPAYSITTLGAIPDPTTSSTSPHAPAFSSGTLTKSAATAYGYYSQSLAADATDADGDTLTFRKISGPAWLTIWSDGSLTGTPDNTHAGPNQFVVQVSDPAGRTATANLSLTVSSGTPPAPPALEAVNFTPTADTFIFSGAQADTVQTLDAFLDIRSTASTSFARVPYLKFDVSGLNGNPTSATLNLYSHTLSATVTVYSTPATWSADALTWNNRPDFPSIGTVVTTQAISPGWNQINLDALVTSAGTYSIALNESANSLQTVSSTRGSFPPYLAVQPTASASNYQPTISADTVAALSATSTSAYSGQTLAGFATDADGDTLTYAKISGPAWLIIASDGALSGTPAAGDLGLNTWTVSVTDPHGGASTFTLTLTVQAPPTSFTSWVAGYFNSSEQADATLSGADADPDADGLPNLIEYALGSHPRNAAPAARPELAAAGSEWIFSYMRPADRPDLTYTVERSADLATWTTTGVTHERTATGTTETWRGRTAKTAGVSAFFRLRVVRAAATIASTPPAGGIFLTLAAGTGTTRATSVFSLPLWMEPGAVGTVSGRVSALTASTLSDSAAQWTAGALSQASLPCFLRVTTGAAAGRTFLVSTATPNTSTTLTISAGENTDLRTTGLAIGDSYRLYAADTLVNLLPAGSGVLGGTSPTTADNLLINVGGLWKTYYFNSTSHRWTLVQLGSPDASHTAISPAAGIQYSRLAATPLSVTLIGSVPPPARRQSIANNGTTFLASGWPVGTTLSSTGLQSVPGWRKNVSAASADTVQLLVNGLWSKFYHDGTRWRKVALGSPAADTQVVAGGTALLISRAAGSGSALHTEIAPYTL